MSGSGDWRHVADIGVFQRSRLSELRLSVVENRDGPALMLRRFVRSHHHGQFDASPDPIVIFGERVPELITHLDTGHRALSALREAARA